MIIESLDEYLETVAGYIFDDDKLVTYKWLSKELEVHVDVAKHILWKFWQKYKKEKGFVSTFLLMGILHDDGMRVEVVKEEDLEKAKEKYVNVLSEHVYSLQKVLPNIQLLEMTENGDIKYSAIKCIENNERSNEEMHILRWGTISNEVQRVSDEKVNSISEPVKAKEETSPEKKSDNKKKNADKKGFDNLFGKAVNKQKSTSTLFDTKKAQTDSTNNTKQTFKENIPKTSKKTNQGGLNSFFQQKNEQETKNIVSSETKKNTSPVLKETTEKKIVSENDKKHSKTVHKKKRNRSKDISSVAKRRKRITIESDSSDTDVEEQDEEMKSDEERRIESSPEIVPPVKVNSDSPPLVKIENHKRKVLKTVDKTFEEDGYLVTKKVHVYESCSEDEPEMIETKKPVVSEPQPEPKGKKNVKQTTLMNFFKKA